MIAQRQKERYERLEKEEIEKRKLDQLEEELRETNRQAALEKAHKAAYGQLDHVKNFHSKMMLSDVLKEREIQKATLDKKKEL